jgi:hypothetical protein
MPTRKEIVMELLCQKKIIVAEVCCELMKHQTETLEDMLKQLEDEGCLDDNEGAKILLELLSKNDMPRSVDLVDKEQTSRPEFSITRQ